MNLLADASTISARNGFKPAEMPCSLEQRSADIPLDIGGRRPDGPAPNIWVNVLVASSQNPPKRHAANFVFAEGRRAIHGHHGRDSQHGHGKRELWPDRFLVAANLRLVVAALRRIVAAHLDLARRHGQELEALSALSAAMSASVAMPAELLNVAVSAFGHCLRLLTGDASATVRSPTSRRSTFSTPTHRLRPVGLRSSA
jgi:hypothetical protein